MQVGRRLEQSRARLHYNRGFRLLSPGTAHLATLAEALKLAEQAVASGDRPQAATILRQVLQVVPDEPWALRTLAMLVAEDRSFDEAVELLRRASSAAPDDVHALHNLAVVLRQARRYAESREVCQRALSLQPAMPELYNNLALTLKDAGDDEQALVAFDQALHLNPAYADAHYNRANLLVRMYRLNDAEHSFRRAMELAPADWQAPNNLGNILQLQGRLDEAAVAFELALRLQPRAAEVHRNRALLRLLTGDYAAGWPEYEWRFRMAGAGKLPAHRPPWRGESLAGRTILLVAEQGLGDTLQFIRYSAPLSAKGARVLVDVPPKMYALLRTVPGVTGVGGADLSDYDCFAPLLSLPALFGTTLETIPWSGAYLKADTCRIESWRQKLAAQPGYKIGIAWQGNPDFPGDHYRSAPLAMFAPLAALPDVTLVSLQKGPGSEQVRTAGFRVVELRDFDTGADAFADAAAVIQSLDLVLTSDTAIAHLAGALAAPCWLALQFSANWRWLTGRDDSPWYPSLRLFRQRQFHEWADVFARMTAELASPERRARRKLS